MANVTPEHNENTVLDIRRIPPRDRHPLILIASTMRSEDFVLVNDHEPRPLYYQFLIERADRVHLGILEQGRKYGECGSASDEPADRNGTSGERKAAALRGAAGGVQLWRRSSIDLLGGDAEL